MSRRSRRDWRHDPIPPFSGVMGTLGPQSLPAGAYCVELVVKCHRHRRVTMGTLGRSTVPLPYVTADYRTFMRADPYGRLPEPAGHDEPKYLFTCPECGHNRYMSLEVADQHVAEIWSPWARHVRSIYV